MAKSTRIRRLLVDAGVISPFDLAPGYPGWLPDGVRLVDRLHTLYRRRLSERTAVAGVRAPILYDLEAYKGAFSQSHDYGNVVEMELRGRRFAIRPDNLSWLVVAGTPGQALVCCDPLFRAGTAHPHPLLLDRHIWGVLQMVHTVPGDEVEELLGMHREVSLRFFTDLLTPTLVVDAGPLRSHARRRLLSFTMTEGSKLWLTSTLYALDPALTGPMGGRGEVVEFGITAKLLALGANLHADERGMRLPTASAPATVVLHAADGEPNTLPTGDAIRVERHGGTWAGAVGSGRRRGLPLVVDVSHGRIYHRLGDVTAPLNGPLTAQRLTDSLAEHDDSLWKGAVAAQQPLYGHDVEADARVLPPGEATPDGYNVLGTVVAANYAAGEAVTGHRLVSRHRRLH